MLTLGRGERPCLWDVNSLPVSRLQRERPLFNKPMRGGALREGEAVDLMAWTHVSGEASVLAVFRALQSNAESSSDRHDLRRGRAELEEEDERRKGKTSPRRRRVPVAVPKSPRPAMGTINR